MLVVPAFVLALFLQPAAIVSAHPQQPPAAKPHIAPSTLMPQPPSLPKVDLNSCPFEGCQFGNWRATASVIVYSNWNSARKPVATLAKGDEVTALTGVSLILQPGKGTFERDVPAYGARKDDTAYFYRNCGEGAVDMWVRGRFFACAEASFSWPDDEGCLKNCDGRGLSHTRSQWWAQVRLKDGRTGWVLVKSNFDGTDALARSLPRLPRQESYW